MFSIYWYIQSWMDKEASIVIREQDRNTKSRIQRGTQNDEKQQGNIYANMYYMLIKSKKLCNQQIR